MREFGSSDLVRGRIAQIIAAFTGTVSAVSDGMQYGWTAPVIPLLLAENSPVSIEKSDIVWLENIYMLGGFSGLPITIYCVNKFGRKNSILIAAVQNLISWILIGMATSVEYFYVARFISGIAGNVAFVSAPMYIGEIADQGIRGFLSAIIYLMMLFGILVVYSVAPFVSIPVSSAVGASFLIVQLLTFPFMPESPYYYLLEGKEEEAKTSLQKLRHTKDVEKELEEIAAGIRRQNKEKGRPIDLILIPSNRKALLIMTVLNAAQHFSSFSVILMNLHTILGDADSILRPNTAAIIFSGILLAAATCAAFTMDKAGRKILLCVSSFLTGISLLVIASYFTVKNSGTDISSYRWIPVVTVFIYAATFKYGLGMVPIVLTAELFPTSIKATGMTVADCMYVVFSMISVYLYQYVADLHGIHVPFFIFAGCCFLTTVFTIFYIPETKGKTLEEIQLILKGKNYQNTKESLDSKLEMQSMNNVNNEDLIL